MAENQAVGTSVGAFTTTDPNAGNTHTYTLVAGTGDTDNGAFTIDGGVLKTALSFNYEAKSSYAIRVRSTDQDGLFFENMFVVSVTDANDAPTSLLLSATSVDENRPAGTGIGTLSSTDPDIGSTFTYALVAGSGDSDNASFAIDGNQLRTAASFDFETKSSYSIRVRTTDQGGLSFEQAFTISVNDLDEIPPTVLSTTPSFASSGVLAAGTTSLQVTFSEPMIGGDVASNFELRSQGADGILGNADDVLVGLSPSYSGIVTTLAFSGLVEGVYRLTARSTLTDSVGNALDGNADGVAGNGWVRDFVVAGESNISNGGDLSPLRDINATSAAGQGSSPSNIIDVNGITFFVATTNTTGTELWKSDGTSAGTVLVKDIQEGIFSSYPRYLTNVNGKLYFRADDGVNGYELWQSDGTSGGTVLVKDLRAGVVVLIPVT